jgi:ABC-type multidrug transport system fused ATPase/permease subunit
MTVRWLPWLRLSQVLPTAVMLLLGGWAFAEGLAGLGTVTTIVVYMQPLAGPMEEVMWWMEDMQVSATALRRVLGVRGADAGPRGGRPRGRDIVVRQVRYGIRLTVKCCTA